MTDEDRTENEAEAENAQKKKKGEGETAAGGRGRESAQVSEAAAALMQARGLSLSQITDILRNWRHLNAREVAVRLADFGRDMARVSAHIAVSFSETGVAIVTHFLKQTERLGAALRQLKPEGRPKPQQKNDINLG